MVMPQMVELTIIVNVLFCHGSDGKLIQNLDVTAGMTLGKFIRTKSNEAQHKNKIWTTRVNTSNAFL